MSNKKFDKKDASSSVKKRDPTPNGGRRSVWQSGKKNDTQMGCSQEKYNHL